MAATDKQSTNDLSPELRWMYVKGFIALSLTIVLLLSTVCIALWASHVQGRMEEVSAPTAISGVNRKDAKRVKKEGGAELSRYVPMGLFTLGAALVCGVQTIRIFNSAKSEAARENQ